MYTEIEWKRLDEQFDILSQKCKDIIDCQELAEYDIDDIEFYISECESNRTWSICLADNWLDMVTPRDDKYWTIDEFQEPMEIAISMSDLLIRILKEHIRAKQRI